ncbi:helix-turn-helix transcriptional regulator [Lachnospiraceae bacterium 46-15]
MQDIVSTAKKELCCIQLVNDLPVLRARIGISQEDIAAKIGVSRQTYNSYGAKKRPIPWSVCIALITFFNSNSKTREMMKNNTYLLELMDEIFG